MKHPRRVVIDMSKPEVHVITVKRVSLDGTTQEVANADHLIGGPAKFPDGTEMMAVTVTIMFRGKEVAMFSTLDGRQLVWDFDPEAIHNEGRE